MKIMTTGVVFCSQHGALYPLPTAFERAVHKAGIPDFTLHDLRHMVASHLVMSGAALPTVKELMGHKDITMTLWYPHFSSAHKHSAVRTLEWLGMASRQGKTPVVGRPHKLLKNDSAPLAQLDRASDF